MFVGWLNDIFDAKRMALEVSGAGDVGAGSVRRWHDVMHAKPAISRTEEGATWALPYLRLMATRIQIYGVAIIASVHRKWFMEGEKNFSSVAGINDVRCCYKWKFGVFKVRPKEKAGGR